MNHPDSNNQSDDHLAGPTTLSDRVKSLQLSKYLAEAPKPRNPKLPWFLCLLFAALSALLGWKLANVEEAPSREKAEEEIPAIVPRSSRVVLEAGGFIVPVHRVEVSPKVGGEVIELYIEEGQEVKKHQKLARLDPTKFEFEYRQAKALVDQAKAELEKLENGSREEEIRQAKAALNEAIAQRDQLQDELLRIRQSRAAVPREELVRIESRLRQAQYKVKQLTEAYRLVEIGPRPEEIAKARAAYEHALAQMEAAKYDLENTTVLAPISGRILTKKAEVGDTVRPRGVFQWLVRQPL
ncbi:MAG: hypothetical protein KatS3mg105_3878 [Gemmatales bacterium]|nr:MAG: hypothetical protein KatS3mg105_3878 [Gemmatales bacterium]